MSKAKSNGENGKIPPRKGMFTPRREPGGRGPTSATPKQPQTGGPGSGGKGGVK